MKKQFSVIVGSETVLGTLRECQKAFIGYRDDNDLCSSDLRMHDGIIGRGGRYVGHVSYNGRFWRTTVKGVKLVAKW